MIIIPERIAVGDRYTVIEKKAVLVQDGVIRRIDEAAALLSEFPEETVKDAPGCTLIPGMIDLHTHLGWCEDPAFEGKDFSTSLRAIYAASKMEETLKVGVTTIRDASSGDGLGVALNEAAARGLIKSPRVFPCLVGIAMTGGHGIGDVATSAIQEADGIDEIRKAIRRNKKNGASWIKLLTSEAYRGDELSEEEICFAAREAHRLDLKIEIHAGYGASIESCLAAGVDSIEHGTHLTLEQGKVMVEKNIPGSRRSMSLIMPCGNWGRQVFRSHRRTTQSPYTTTCLMLSPAILRTSDRFTDSVSASLPEQIRTAPDTKEHLLSLPSVNIWSNAVSLLLRLLNAPQRTALIFSA